MKKAVVTGGVRGIGKAVSLALQKKGYCVYAFYEKNENAADEMEKYGVKIKLTQVEYAILKLFMQNVCVIVILIPLTPNILLFRMD